MIKKEFRVLKVQAGAIKILQLQLHTTHTVTLENKQISFITQKRSRIAF